MFVVEWTRLIESSLFGLGSFGRRILALLGQQDALDVWQHTALGNGHSGEQLVQLLVVADGQLQVSRDDSRLLVVAGSVAGQLEDLSRQVLEHSGQVDWRTGTDSLGIVTLTEQTVDTTDWELETSSRRTCLALAADFTSFTST